MTKENSQALQQLWVPPLIQLWFVCLASGFYCLRQDCVVCQAPFWWTVLRVTLGILFLATDVHCVWAAQGHELSQQLYGLYEGLWTVCMACHAYAQQDARMLPGAFVTHGEQWQELVLSRCETKPVHQLLYPLEPIVLCGILLLHCPQCFTGTEVATITVGSSVKPSAWSSPVTLREYSFRDASPVFPRFFPGSTHVSHLLLLPFEEYKGLSYLCIPAHAPEWRD